jgi:hypothetical protein
MAGGSHEAVQIKSIRVTNGTDYELVVTPLIPDRGGYLDPYMGRCDVFTVRGTYSTLHSLRFPSFVTREGYLAALAYLSDAHASGRVVNLGWMGGGFVPEESTSPCVVRSRALQLFTEQEVTSVLSYHDAI